MPDQSQSNAPVSGKTDTSATDPADTSANDPKKATPESQESNVTRASEGEKTQAAQTIDGDPVIGSGDVQNPPENQFKGSVDTYDNEDEWPYRRLQAEAKEKTGDGSGKREELIARLRGGTTDDDGDDTPRHLRGQETTDAELPKDSDTPRGSVPSEEVDNGGIERTNRGQQHAEVLQGLSADRRKQQLAAVKDRSGQSEA